MTDTEKDLRDRLARLQSMLDQLDRETQRMREFEARQRRERKMYRCGARR
jgi:uncharacterized protein YukE